MEQRAQHRDKNTGTSTSRHKRNTESEVCDFSDYEAQCKDLWKRPSTYIIIHTYRQTFIMAEIVIIA